MVIHIYPSFTASVTCGSWRDIQINWPGSQDQLQPSLLHDFEQSLSLLGSNSSSESSELCGQMCCCSTLNSDVEGVPQKYRCFRDDEAGKRWGEKSWRNGVEVFSGICFPAICPLPASLHLSVLLSSTTLKWVGMLIWARIWCDAKREVPSSICKQISSSSEKISPCSLRKRMIFWKKKLLFIVKTKQTGMSLISEFNFQMQKKQRKSSKWERWT